MKKLVGNITTLKCIFITLLFINVGYSQTISPKKLDATAICASASFNQYNATFVYRDFPSGTTFSIELSNENGSFANPIATTINTITNISATEQNINFAIPTTIVGSPNYKLRAKSSTGVTSAPFLNFSNEESFSVYFYTYTKSFFINDANPNASFCSGGSLRLSVYNPTPENQNSSPANYSNIKYKWYRNNLLLSGQSGTSIIVNTTGEYYSEIDYGPVCSDVNFGSNRVNVVNGDLANASINSSAGNPICSATLNTTLSTVSSALSYQWYKDNKEIEGATASEYITSEAGNYSVDIDFDGCKTTTSINLLVETLNATINVEEISFIGNGQIVPVEITTSVSNPEYKWFFEEELLPSVTTNTFNATQVGNYKAIVTDISDECFASKVFEFQLSSVIDPNVTKIPNTITPNNDDVNDFWVLPEEYAIGSNAKVVVMDPQGKIVVDTKEYQNNWPQEKIEYKNTVPIYYYIITPENGSAKKGTITIIN